MTFGLRLVVVAFAAFGAAGLAGSIAASWIARRLLTSRSPHSSALLQLRLLPAVTSLLVSVVAIASFERFEPRVGQERTGVLLLAFAVVAAATLATMAIRFCRAHWTTRRALQRWLRTAEPISLPDVDIPAFAIASSFPIVAVVGIVRPRLIVARAVIDACSADELDVILAHERSHVRRRDNAGRVLMWIVPDVLMWGATARRLEQMWQIAAEEAADTEAAGTRPARRLRLAEALIRVARLASAGASTADIPASALYRGEDIVQRVRRLLDPPAEAGPSQPAAGWLAPAATALLVLCLLALHPIHELVEAAVAYLP